MSHARSGDAMRVRVQLARAARGGQRVWKVLKRWKLATKVHSRVNLKRLHTGCPNTQRDSCDNFCGADVFFFLNQIFNSTFKVLQTFPLDVRFFFSLSLMCMFLQDISSSSALPLIHLAEQRSPRPRTQWSSVSSSETMQQDATKETLSHNNRDVLLVCGGTPA